MFDRIARLGDRMLARVVPATEAAAVVCWYEYQGTCVRRYCCTGGGIPGTYCTPYRYTC